MSFLGEHATTLNPELLVGASKVINSHNCGYCVALGGLYVYLQSPAGDPHTVAPTLEATQKLESKACNFAFDLRWVAKKSEPF